MQGGTTNPEKIRQRSINPAVPLVSVIVPIYNGEEYIVECLDSLLKQTYENIEVLCLDDGSIDNSAIIVSQYVLIDSRFVLYECSHRGVSATRNEGMRLAKGKYIQFLDADDILLPTKIEKQVTMLENTQADVCVCHHTMFTDSPENTWDNEFTMASYDLSKEGFLYKWGSPFLVAIHSGLFKLSFLKDKLIYFREDLLAYEDWFVWTELVYHGAYFIENSDISALYRVHEFSATRNKELMQRNRIIAFLRMYEFLPEQDKIEFLQRGANSLVHFFAKVNSNKLLEQKVNSIDYRLGAAILKPVHKLSSFIKKYIKNKCKKSLPS